MNPLRLAQRIITGWLPFGSKHCVLCRHDVWGFLPYKGGYNALPALVQVLDMVGSDVDNFSCPRCGAHDRERHLLLYMTSSGLLSALRGKSIVHFAPEKRLSYEITTADPGSYIRCDLYPESPDIEKVDILSMHFESQSFDILIANHVLEHVADDRKALSEIRRVLKVGGYAILQTPYARKLHATWQDAGIVEDASRLQAYGQADHVRLYGRDIFDRITSAGLRSCVAFHADLLGQVDASIHGVNPEEPFFLFQKL